MSHNLLNSQEPNFVNVGIRKFDVTKMKPDAIVLLVGKRGTGKSILMKNLLYHVHKHFDAGVAMAPTQDTIDTLREFVPDSCIYNKCEPDVIQKIIDVQEVLQNQKPRRDKNIFVIFDDCMYDKRALKNDAIRNLFMNGRHYNLFFINAMQYVMDMEPSLRANVDYVFALRDTARNTREKLWKNFFGIFPTYDQFSEAFDACTQNYECMVIDNRATKSSKIEDCVYWYKADTNVPEFVLGNRNFWKLDSMFATNEKKSLIKGSLGGIPALSAGKGKNKQPTPEPVAARPTGKRGGKQKDIVVFKRIPDQPQQPVQEKEVDDEEIVLSDCGEDEDFDDNALLEEEAEMSNLLVGAVGNKAKKSFVEAAKTPLATKTPVASRKEQFQQLNNRRQQQVVSRGLPVVAKVALQKRDNVSDLSSFVMPANLQQFRKKR